MKLTSEAFLLRNCTFSKQQCHQEKDEDSKEALLRDAGWSIANI